MRIAFKTTKGSRYRFRTHVKYSTLATESTLVGDDQESRSSHAPKMSNLTMLEMHGNSSNRLDGSKQWINRT